MYTTKKYAKIWCLIVFCYASLLCAEDRALKLIEHVKHCIFLAEQDQSRIIDNAILNIPGMSGNKLKHLLNNLCSLPHTSYLEIGCWQGSTLVAALYQNQPFIDLAVVIDNWSERFPLVREKRVYTSSFSFQSLPAFRKWGTPREEFLNNTEHFLPHNAFRLLEQDCFSIDKERFFPLPINIYFYDGAHSIEDHERAFTYFNDIFEDIFIAVIDDWNWDSVRKGTQNAFAQLHYEVLFHHEIYTLSEEKTGWWNGLYITVIKKT